MNTEKLKRHNGVIESIGYYFVGNFNCGGVRVVFENSCGTCSFDLTSRKVISKFVRMFSNSNIDFENGFYIEELKGQNFCGWFDEQDRIVGFSTIIDDCGHDITMLNGGEE